MPAYLLDKSVVRRTIEGLARLHRVQPLYPDQATCLTLLYAGVQDRFTAYITPQSLHIMERLSARDEVRDFLDAVEVIQVTRYTRRWARRLREYGFTREDAAILGLATFGTDLAGSILGVDAVITLDLPFINNFHTRKATLNHRLRAMTQQLPVPFRHASLPALWQPTKALAELS
jgi:predicted nucleic acid-binding protein